MGMMAPPPDDQGYYEPRKKRSIPVAIILVVVGVGCCFGVGILAAILFPVFAQAREAAKSQACSNNLRRMGRAMLSYAADYDDRLPDSATWMDTAVAKRTRESQLHCPGLATKSPDTYGYAFNAALTPLSLIENPVPNSTPMIFDSTELGRNAVAGIESLPSPGRHRSGHRNNAVQVDGSARNFDSNTLDR